MTVLIEKFGIAYHPAPKVACTSVKSACFLIENGVPFSNFEAMGIRYYVHNFYTTGEFPIWPIDLDLYRFRFCLIRDPVDRLLSCYSNRVVYHEDLQYGSTPELAAAIGLSLTPSLEEFVRNLARYCEISPDIAHHAAAMTFFLGRDPAYYSHIYTLRQIPELALQLQSLTGLPVEIGHEQRGGPKFDAADLPGPVLAAIRKHYEEDYDVFGALLDRST